MRKTGVIHFFLLWLIFLAGPTLAAVPQADTRALTVIYDQGDEPETSGFSRIVEGLDDSPNVVVYRVAVNDPFPIQHTGRPIHLAFNDQGGIAVIYPDIGEPYRSVFTRIIEGIEEKAKSRVTSYAVGGNQNSQDLTTELRRQNIRVVIALGRNGLKAAANLDRDIGVVVGGVLSVPETEARGMSVYSLAPDPGLLFERLKTLMPGVRRVFVVYDPRQNAWLIRLAREAARAHGLELVAQEAGDLKTAMRLYQDNLAAADPKRDAFWLPQDSITVDETSVLPLVLQESWSRSLAVFSSSVSHVKRGALFSLYPDNVGLGRNLAESALNRNTAGRAITPLKEVLMAVNVRTASHLGLGRNLAESALSRNTAGRAITPLKEVLMAVNVRTASHLGLGIGQRQQQTFDMVYPEP